MSEARANLQHLNATSAGAVAADTVLITPTANKACELKQLRINNRVGGANDVTLSDGAVAAARHILRVSLAANTMLTLTEEQIGRFCFGIQGTLRWTSSGAGGIDIDGAVEEY